MLTIKEYNELSPARKAYIEKQANKKGIEIKDYLIKNNQKNTPIIESVSFKHNGKTIHSYPGIADDNIDPFTQFKADAGLTFKKLKKTSYRLDLNNFSAEVMQSAHNMIPSRMGELTCIIPFEGKELCATFKLKDKHRTAIADALAKGHMGVTLKFGFSGKIQTANEWIRLLKITDVIPSEEVYTAGGDFRVMIPSIGMNASFKQVAQAIKNPMQVEANYA